MHWQHALLWHWEKLLFGNLWMMTFMEWWNKCHLYPCFIYIYIHILYGNKKKTLETSNTNCEHNIAILPRFSQHLLFGTQKQELTWCRKFILKARIPCFQYVTKPTSARYFAMQPGTLQVQLSLKNSSGFTNKYFKGS